MHTQMQSFTSLTVADGRALGVKDGLELLKQGVCHLVVKCEIEVDVVDSVTDASTGAPYASHEARHIHMWTFVRGGIKYEDDEEEKAKGTKEFTLRQAGHRNLGHQFMEARGVAKFLPDAKWRIADVSPWNSSLHSVLKQRVPEQLPKIVVNRKQ